MIFMNEPSTRSVTLKYTLSILTLNFVSISGSALYGAFLRSRGLSLTEIGLVDGVFVLVQLLFVAVGGSLADKYGRRKTLCYGLLFWGLGFFVYGVSLKFEHFLLAEALVAFGTVLNANSLDSWYVDEVRRLNRDKYYDYSRVFGATATLSSITSLSGGLFAGWLGMFSLNVPFLFAAFSFFLLSPLLYLLLTENKGEGAHLPLLQILKRGYKNLKKNNVLMLLAFSTYFLSFSIPFFTLTLLPYFYDIGLSAQEMGSITALLLFTNSLSAAFSIPKKSFKKLAYLLFTCLVLVILSFAGMSTHTSLNAFMIFALLWEVGTGMNRPLLRAWLNLEIETDRATTLSFVRILGLLGSLCGMLTMGVIVDTMDTLLVGYLQV